MHSAFIWYFLSMKGRIGPQEFRLGLLGLVLVDMLVVRIARSSLIQDPNTIASTLRPIGPSSTLSSLSRSGRSLQSL